MTPAELLDELMAQESRLVFDSFDEDTAWALGVALREAALAAFLPVAISIRRNGQRLFHAALPGASADNDGWLERKSAVVDRYGCSSLRVGEQFRVDGGSFEAGSGWTHPAMPLTEGRSPSWCGAPAVWAPSRSPDCRSWRTTSSSSTRSRASSPPDGDAVRLTMERMTHPIGGPNIHCADGESYGFKAPDKSPRARRSDTWT